jgi:hypothetical protein
MKSRGLRSVLLVACIGLFSHSAIAQLTKQPALHGFPIQGTPHHKVFESNHGQFPDAVKFVARSQNYLASFGLGGVNFISRDGPSTQRSGTGASATGAPPSPKTPSMHMRMMVYTL